MTAPTNKIWNTTPQILLALLICLVWLNFPQQALAKTLGFEDKSWDINLTSTHPVKTAAVRQDTDLISMAKDVMLGQDRENYATLFNDESLILVQQIISEINQSSIPASLKIKNNKATAFEPGQDGRSVDIYELYLLLADSKDSEKLPVIISRPKTTLAETNDLGINELVAEGQSDFSGSPKNRVVNIKVGSKKFNGLIIAPGEEFSFNKYLGDVDAANGFLPELVIKKTGLVPEFGGGLCQVSSTAFRAAMNAGVPINERKNHSFAVHYYSPQGTDATIYPGVSDLRFVNNLNSSLLIHTRIDGSKLFFDFYSTKDERQVAFDGPYQYDKRSDGSMKAVWTRKVSLNGKISEQTFRSNYLPPALFKKVSAVESNIPNPETPAPDPTPPPAQTN